MNDGASASTSEKIQAVTLSDRRRGDSPTRLAATMAVLEVLGERPVGATRSKVAEPSGTEGVCSSRPTLAVVGHSALESLFLGSDEAFLGGLQDPVRSPVLI